MFECCVFLKKVDKDLKKMEQELVDKNLKKMEQELEINATLEPPLSPSVDGHIYK